MSEQNLLNETLYLLGEETLNENLIDKFEKFVGKPLKDGRMNIKGLPIDLDGSNSDEGGIEAEAVDSDVAKEFAKLAKAAGFKVRIVKGTGLLITL